jgi:uncharacterized protein (TIGR03067 family)
MLAGNDAPREVTVMTAEPLARAIRRPTPAGLRRYALPLTLALAATAGAGDPTGHGRSEPAARNADGKQGDAVRVDRQRLQGIWKLESMEVEGRKAASDQIRGWLLVIEGDQYNPGSGQLSVEYSYRLNPARNPKAIDLIPHDGIYRGRTLRGIYVLQDDRLTVCRARFPDGERPAGFITHPESGWVTTVWKRQKP